jgi:hypothetical protein
LSRGLLLNVETNTALLNDFIHDILNSIANSVISKSRKLKLAKLVNRVIISLISGISNCNSDVDRAIMSIASRITNEIANYNPNKVKPLEDFFPEVTLVLLTAWDFSRSLNQESEIDSITF